jgi:predicted nucleic acid-binding protein
MRDLLIAAYASAIDATFVTCDRGDFRNDAVQSLLDVDVI